MGKIIECHFFARNKRPQAEQPRQQTQIVVASCLQYAGKFTAPLYVSSVGGSRHREFQNHESVASSCP